MSISSDSTIQALASYTTCDISDALQKLKYPNAGFLPNLSMFSPLRREGDTKIIGRAYTVLYADIDDARPKLSSHYIDFTPPNSVLFISAPSAPCALYGGLMSLRAQTLGAVGTVVNGRIRDLNEHREIGYPVFAKDTGTSSPNTLLKVVAINVQLDVDGTAVHPGDIIMGDVDGVVVIPQDLEQKVLEIVRGLVAADEKVKEAIKGGMGFQEASKKFRG